MISGKEKVITFVMGFGLVSESLRQVTTGTLPNSETMIFNALMLAIENRLGSNKKETTGSAVAPDTEEPTPEVAPITEQPTEEQEG